MGDSVFHQMVQQSAPTGQSIFHSMVKAQNMQEQVNPQVVEQEQAASNKRVADVGTAIPHGGPDWTIPRAITDVAVAAIPGSASVRGIGGAINAIAQGKSWPNVALDTALNAIPGYGVATGKGVVREASQWASPEIMDAARKTVGPEALSTLTQNMPEIVKKVGTYFGLAHNLPGTIGAALLGSIVKLGDAGKAFAKTLVTPGMGQDSARVMSVAAQMVKHYLGQKDENGND